MIRRPPTSISELSSDLAHITALTNARKEAAEGGKAGGDVSSAGQNASGASGGDMSIEESAVDAREEEVRRKAGMSAMERIGGGRG